MKKINELLVVLIFILTAVLAAAVGFKAYGIYDRDRRLAREQEEIELAQLFARNEEAQNRVQEMQAEIQELTQDKEALANFIGQIQTGNMTGEDSQNISGTVSGNGYGNGTVSGNGYGNGTVSGNGYGNGTVSGNGYGNGTVSGNGYGNGTVSGNGYGSGTVSGNGSVSGNGEINYYDGTMTDNSIFDAWREIYEQPEGMTLTQRRELRTSLEETLEVNQSDRERIAENKIDFSGMKIACLGDSITAAANLEGTQDYQQYSYPARLKELLKAQEVYNLGIGGSSIGRYWADAYVDRYQEIPEDVDIIIVMGGTNDGFCVSDKEFGSLDERAYRTFCGDLDELMRGLRENYPDARIFFATPLPNILQDYLMSERDYLLPQQKFVDVILTLAEEYDYEVVDLYNSNILDSHDANVVADYIPDGVHGNPDGYQIIAEHFAAEIVEYYEEAKEDAGDDEMSEDDAAAAGDGEDADDRKSTISGNSTVSGNETDDPDVSSDGEKKEKESFFKRIWKKK